jgi:hypothetical protein
MYFVSKYREAQLLTDKELSETVLAKFQELVGTRWSASTAKKYVNVLQEWSH